MKVLCLSLCEPVKATDAGADKSSRKKQRYLRKHGRLICCPAEGRANAVGEGKGAGARRNAAGLK